MNLRDLARAYYRAQRALVRRTIERVAVIWSDLDQNDLDGSWRAAGLADRLLVAVAQSQGVAVEMAERYVDLARAEQGDRSDPAGVLVAPSLVAIAGDGRDLDSLLAQPLIRTKVGIRDGRTPADALKVGRGALGTIAGTQVADAGRTAADVAMVARPSVTGWVRMLTPPSCGRCAVLAGRRYRWNAGFERHPLCDCTACPAIEDAADDVRTDPDAYFAGLSPDDQDRYFTAAGAQAIRAGADIGQVVNARRRAAGLSVPGQLTLAEQHALRGDRGRLARVDVYGRPLAVTTEGVTVRGLAGQVLARGSGATKVAGQRHRSAKTPRLMPEAIKELAAGDRDEAIRLLRRFGYITG